MMPASSTPVGPAPMTMKVSKASRSAGSLAVSAFRTPEAPGGWSSHPRASSAPGPPAPSRRDRNMHGSRPCQYYQRVVAQHVSIAQQHRLRTGIDARDIAEQRRYFRGSRCRDAGSATRSRMSTGSLWRPDRAAAGRDDGFTPIDSVMRTPAPFRSFTSCSPQSPSQQRRRDDQP